MDERTNATNGREYATKEENVKPAFNAGSINKVNMITFDELWVALYEHGASEKKREGTLRYWETLTEEQQERVFNSISSKLREGKFVQYDPIRAIKENTPKVAREPTNYNGKDLPKEPVETGYWNGKWGTYTLSDIAKYRMPKKGGH